MKDILTIIDNLTNPSPREENIDTAERILSAIGGGYLLYAAWNGKHAKAIKGTAGAMLLYRAFTGQRLVYSAMGKHRIKNKEQNITIRSTVYVNKPRGEVYAYWRKLEQLPYFMKHLVSVVPIDDVHSIWTATLPGLPTTITWKAEIVEEERNEFLAWASLPGSVIENAGMVEFTDWEKGTEINAQITYRAPLGKAGEKVARLLTPFFHKMIERDLQHFKEVIEENGNPITVQD
ncbi:MAG: cyclase/dehydrase [Azospira oryzae]|jgi:uncharacterized membrane protein|nr:MAG: cyclase/dehydrase [Azospira oryzae]